LRKNKYIFWRYSAVQLATKFFALFLCATILMAVLAYLKSAEEIKKRAYRDLTELNITLKKTIETGDMAELTEQIEFLSQGARYGESLFYLVNDNGQLLAGNIQSTIVFGGRKTIPIKNILFQKSPDDDISAYFAVGMRVNGGYLIIGKSDSEVEEIGEAILNAFFISFSIVLLLTGGIAWYSVNSVNKRIKRIEDVLLGVSDGNLRERIALPVKINDDIGWIAINIDNMLETLEATMESLRQISADMAHELKTPLQRLYQELGSLAADDNLTQTSRSHVNKSLQEAKGLIEIFQALLGISQLESGERRNAFKQVDLKDILVNVTDIYEPVAEDASHNLQLDLTHAETTKIVGDRELLTQLFVNLVENSIRHCPSSSQINLSLSQTEGAVCVVVSDNGHGIPEVHREKVFERLYRLDKSRSTLGNGLGLSLVKAIADLHRCSIELLDNKPGLKVLITFPV
jgi:signal transduction histidine kinase